MTCLFMYLEKALNNTYDKIKSLHIIITKRIRQSKCWFFFSSCLSLFVVVVFVVVRDEIDTFFYKNFWSFQHSFEYKIRVHNVFKTYFSYFIIPALRFNSFEPFKICGFLSIFKASYVWLFLHQNVFSFWYYVLIYST